MKLIIDISEDCYRYIKELQAIIVARGTCKTIQMDVINAIKNGTPVQTGEWIETTRFTEIAGFMLHCPICHEDTLSSHESFCPNCGANCACGAAEEFKSKWERR